MSPIEVEVVQSPTSDVPSAFVASCTAGMPEDIEDPGAIHVVQSPQPNVQSHPCRTAGEQPAVSQFTEDSGALSKTPTKQVHRVSTRMEVESRDTECGSPVKIAPSTTAVRPPAVDIPHNIAGEHGTTAAFSCKPTKRVQTGHEETGQAEQSMPWETNLSPSNGGPSTPVVVTRPSRGVTFVDDISELKSKGATDTSVGQDAARQADNRAAHDNVHKPGDRLKQEVLPDSKPILVLFDLNGVLVHREPFGSTRPHSDTPNAVFTLTCKKRVVFIRRRLEQFFSSLRQHNIHVGIWTSAQSRNAYDLVSALRQHVPSFNSLLELHRDLVLDQQYCINLGKVDLQNSDKEVHIKSERELVKHCRWENDLVRHQIVLVDDSPVKNAINDRVIGIYPRTFDPFNQKTTDHKVMNTLLRYLIQMKIGTLQPFNFAMRNPLHKLFPDLFVSSLDLSKIERTALWDQIIQLKKPKDYSHNLKLLWQLHESELLTPDEYVLNARRIFKYKGQSPEKAKEYLDAQLRRSKTFLSRIK